MADLLKWCLDNIEYKSVLKRIRHNRMQTYSILKIIQKLTSSLFTCGTRWFNVPMDMVYLKSIALAYYMYIWISYINIYTFINRFMCSLNHHLYDADAFSVLYLTYCAFIMVCRRSRKTFLFLFCFLFLLFFLSFLFFSTADFLQRFLRHFSTDLYQIWHVDSPWWDKEPEYNFKSIGPGVWTGRGSKVLLCFIIGKTLYTVRRDKNFT